MVYLSRKHLQMLLQLELVMQKRLTMNALPYLVQGAVSILSDISGSLGSITAGYITGTSIRGGQFILDGGTLDLRLGNILWGTNVPQASYAENAGNANTLKGSYTASSFSLNGHDHGSS